MEEYDGTRDEWFKFHSYREPRDIEGLRGLHACEVGSGDLYQYPDDRSSIWWSPGDNMLRVWSPPSSVGSDRTHWLTRGDSCVLGAVSCNGGYAGQNYC